jgi:hypothetical protein
MLLSKLDIVNGMVRTKDSFIEEYKGYLIETEDGYIQAIDRVNHNVIFKTNTRDVAFIKEEIDRKESK